MSGIVQLVLSGVHPCNTKYSSGKSIDPKVQRGV